MKKEDGTSSRFLIMLWSFFSLLTKLSVPKVPQEIRLGLGNHFPQLKTPKNPFFENVSFSEKSHAAENSFSSQNCFFLSHCSREIVEVPFDQMKVWESAAKKTEKRYFQQTLRKYIRSTGSKSNKEVNL